ADAAGGVSALAQASDRAISEVLDWVAGLALPAAAQSVVPTRAP
ncbi:ABC-type transport auxiliary lipoprotein family protein, partial [Ralstonia pseudosolanacearum]